MALWKVLNIAALRLRVKVILPIERGVNGSYPPYGMRLETSVNLSRWSSNINRGM